MIGLRLEARYVVASKPTLARLDVHSFFQSLQETEPTKHKEFVSFLPWFKLQ